MNAHYKSKAEIKADQASQASRDNQSQASQDGLNGSIPTIQGLETSLEILYSGHRTKARQITQGIKCQAYRDELEEAIAELNQGEVQPDFLQTLQRDYAPALTQNQVLMPLLSQSPSAVGAEEPLTDADDTLPLSAINQLIDRDHLLSELERIKSITDAEREELHEVRAKLFKLGVTE